MVSRVRFGAAMGVVGVLLCGCAGDASTATDPLSTRVGELHLHQYASSGIAASLFVDPPTPLAQTDLDSALPNVYTPALIDGPCKAIIYGSCAPDCAPPDPVDGGSLSVAGLAHPLELRFDPRSGGYLQVKTSDLAEAAGAQVTVRSTGTAEIPGFEGVVELPRALDAASTLDAGIDDGLELSWTPADPGTKILVELTVVPRMGTAVIARCILDDEAARLALPLAVMALMPRGPRQIDLEISRYRLVDVPVGGGRSVVLHGSDTVPFARNEP
jgi:hypothetical protein